MPGVDAAQPPAEQPLGRQVAASKELLHPTQWGMRGGWRSHLRQVVMDLTKDIWERRDL